MQGKLVVIFLICVHLVAGYPHWVKENLTVSGTLRCERTRRLPLNRFFDVELRQMGRVSAKKRVKDLASFELHGAYQLPMGIPIMFPAIILNVNGDCYGSESKSFKINHPPLKGRVDFGSMILGDVK